MLITGHRQIFDMVPLCAHRHICRQTDILRNPRILISSRNACPNLTIMRVCVQHSVLHFIRGRQHSHGKGVLVVCNPNTMSVFLCPRSQPSNGALICAGVVGKLPKGFRPLLDNCLPRRKTKAICREGGEHKRRNWCVSLLPTSPSLSPALSLRCHQLDGCGLIIDREREREGQQLPRLLSPELPSSEQFSLCAAPRDEFAGNGQVRSPLREMIDSRPPLSCKRRCNCFQRRGHMSSSPPSRRMDVCVGGTRARELSAVTGGTGRGAGGRGRASPTSKKTTASWANAAAALQMFG